MVTRVVRVVAPNPSPMTLEGTNTYLAIADDCAAVVDPGPDIAAHRAAIVAAAAREQARIVAIAVTHGHPDHAPSAAPLHARTQAPVYAHAAARFPFDVALADGETIALGHAALRAIATPGHVEEHLAFAFDADASVFTGDTIVGRGTIVIAPPHGDMRDYQRSLARLRAECASMRVLYGGHGPAVGDPLGKIDEYVAHRHMRERELVAALAQGERTIPELVAAMYAATPAVLWPAAARQLLAYLIALEREGRVRVRDLERALAPGEAAILNPDLSAIADPEAAAVARAELGYDDRVDRIAVYALTRMPSAA